MKRNLNSSEEFHTFNRKKNPRDMTIQELDEYIKKNRQKNYNPNNTESKSLNSSFTTNNHFGLFNETNLNKTNNIKSENRNLYKNSSYIQKNNETNDNLVNSNKNEKKKT